MLKELLAQHQEQANNHPISGDEYDTWKHSKVTKRFFADFQDAILSQVEDVGKHQGAERRSHHALQFGTSYDTHEALKSWLPLELSEEADYEA